ncbi:V-type ATP synthase subunit E [Clostridium oceanicum]|uniref:V-type proton ATPase subunit E n=1 Tax=Clostridium oceanicum TaxID=1543 RepID=A0ABN1JT92_9CLOT
MSNLDNLTSKILEDSNKRVKSILDKAENEKKSIIDSKVKTAKDEAENILKKSQIEAKSKAERVISNTYLKVRNEKLRAKQEIVDSVFDKAVESLNKMSKDKYLKFVKDVIGSLDIDGDEELIVSKEDAKKIDDKFLNELNNELANKGKKSQLKLSQEKRDLNGGFILYKNGIEINNSYDALVFSLRDELEQEIVSALFS